jgi:hypothetical protein
MILTGETKELGEKSVPVPLLFTTISTWPYLVTNPGFRGEKATNRLSYVTTFVVQAFLGEVTLEPQLGLIFPQSK